MVDLEFPPLSSTSQPLASDKYNSEKNYDVKTPDSSYHPSIILTPSTTSTASTPDTRAPDATKQESPEAPASPLLSSPSTLDSDTTKINQFKMQDIGLQSQPEGVSSTIPESDNQISPDVKPPGAIGQSSTIVQNGNDDTTKDACSLESKFTPGDATTVDQPEDAATKKNAAALLKKQKAALWAQQHEKARIKYLQQCSENNLNTTHAKRVSLMISEIARYFVQSAEAAGDQPLDHAIKFGERKGEPITAQLKQVYALLPQAWQHLVRDNTGHNIVGDSWLDENIMNALVHLAVPESDEDVEDRTVFGLSLASCCNKSINKLYVEIQSQDYLQYIIQNVLPNLEDNAAEAKIFTFPSDTKRIVWFWNYDELHWVTIVTEISNFRWTHWIFDSLEDNKSQNDWGGHVKEEFCTYIGDIERCIQKISGIPKPVYPSSRVRKGSTPQQQNLNDCGIMTVYNTVVLLKGEKVNGNVTGTLLRMYFIQFLLRELQRRFGPLPDEQSDEEEVSEEAKAMTPGQDSTTPTVSDVPAAMNHSFIIPDVEDINSMFPELANVPSSPSWSIADTTPSNPHCGQDPVEDVKSAKDFAKGLEAARAKLLEFDKALPRSRSPSPPAVDIFADSPPNPNPSLALTNFGTHSGLYAEAQNESTLSSEFGCSIEADVVPISQVASNDDSRSTAVKIEPSFSQKVDTASYSEAFVQATAGNIGSMPGPSSPARTYPPPPSAHCTALPSYSEAVSGLPPNAGDAMPNSPPPPTREGSPTRPRPMFMDDVTMQAAAHLRKHYRNVSSSDEQPNKKVGVREIYKDLTEDPSN